MIHGEVALKVVGHDPITILVEHDLFDACLSYISLARIHLGHDLVERLVLALAELPTAQYTPSVSRDVERQDRMTLNAISIVLMGDVQSRGTGQIPFGILAVPNARHFHWPRLLHSLENGLICIEGVDGRDHRLVLCSHDFSLLISRLLVGIHDLLNLLVSM